MKLMSINEFYSLTQYSSRNPEFRVWPPTPRPKASSYSPASSARSALFHCFERLQETYALLASLLGKTNAKQNKQPLKKHEISQSSQSDSVSQTVKVCAKERGLQSLIWPLSWEYCMVCMVIKVRWYLQFANLPIGGNGLNRCPPIRHF